MQRQERGVEEGGGGGKQNGEESSPAQTKGQGKKNAHDPAPKRGQSPPKPTGKGPHLAQVIEEDEMSLERLYRPNTCMVQGPETGRVAEAAELAQGGSAMIEKAKSIGREGAKLWPRGAPRAAGRNSSDPDDVAPMKEFPNLKADLYMIRQERKESLAL